MDRGRFPRRDRSVHAAASRTAPATAVRCRAAGVPGAAGAPPVRAGCARRCGHRRRRPFEEFLLPFVERRYRQIYDEIREKREISDTLRQVLDKAVSEAKTEFVQTKGIRSA